MTPPNARTTDRVIVIGGGLAGLAAAISCADAGAGVTLLESRPRLGGATWSTDRHGFTIDNGQHVFLRCCTAYRAFIRRLRVEHLLTLQDRLSIPVLSAGGRCAWLRRYHLPRPLHLAPSLLGFSHLPLVARLRIARTTGRLAALDVSDRSLDQFTFGGWLRAQGERDAAIETFWDLLVRPTLNLPAREASLALAVKVFQTGLLSDADAGDLGYANVPLDEVHARPATRVLEKGGATIVTQARVERVDSDGLAPPVVWLRDERIVADAVIVATPHDAAARLLPPAAEVDCDGLGRLDRSPIVNLHVVFDRRVTSLPVVAGFGSRLQWIFDRTHAAGLTSGQYLAVSLSAADEYLDHSVEGLRALFLPEFRAVFPDARKAGVEQFHVTREPAATFRQGSGTLRLRPGTRTAAAGIYLAGAWTDTGWPATMEGAVRSGLAAANAALEDLRRTGHRARAA